MPAAGPFDEVEAGGLGLGVGGEVMPLEQLRLHQRLQRDSSADQGGGVGMAELMRDDVIKPGLVDGPVEFGSDGVLGQPPSQLPWPGAS